MRKSDIIEKVIELSKKIAEHWRMEIYVGGWICLIQIKRGKQKFNPELVDGKIFWIDKDTRQLYWGSFGEIHKKEYIPIPSISDCLDKLRELGYFIRIQDQPDFYEVGIWKDVEDENIAGGASPNIHEALLSALLEVLKSGVETEKKGGEDG